MRPLWTWMPAVAAFAAAALTGGRAAVSDLGRRLVRWRVAWQWYLVVLAGPAAFSLAVGAVYVLLGGSSSGAFPAAFTTPLPSLTLFLVILTVTDGLRGAPGWRGFALPRLLGCTNALVASLFLGVLWAGWHLPLIWTEGSSLSGSPVWLLFLNLPATAVLFTWVFLRTRGSVLLVALLHGATNLFVVSPVPGVSGDLTLALLAVGLKWLLVVVASSCSQAHNSPAGPIPTPCPSRQCGLTGRPRLRLLGLQPWPVLEAPVAGLPGQDGSPTRSTSLVTWFESTRSRKSSRLSPCLPASTPLISWLKANSANCGAPTGLRVRSGPQEVVVVTPARHPGRWFRRISLQSGAVAGGHA